MAFSSMLFMWFFLPTVWLIYIVIDKTYRNLLLLIASIIFYTWGEPIKILVLGCTIYFNYHAGNLIERTLEIQRKKIFIGIIVYDLMLLVVFKYFTPLAMIFTFQTNTQGEIFRLIAPMGLSFYIFSCISYVVDIYLKKGDSFAKHKFVDMALYTMFFAKVTQGPIVQWRDFAIQTNSRILTYKRTNEGIRKICYGLVKKVIIADTLGSCVDSIFSLELVSVNSTLTWIAVIFYTLQIYYDFSGYSDIAIGIAKLFGFDFAENFNLPYISTSIREFWRRWHISLGAWFREYVYIPLGGNRNGKIVTCMNYLVVFFLTGLWHGATVNYILWGMWHGIFVIIESLGFGQVLKKHKILSYIYTLGIVMVGWLFFRVENVIRACCYLKRMLLPWLYLNSDVSTREILSHQSIIVAVFAILGCGILQLIYKHHFERFRERYENSVFEIVICSILVVYCFMLLAGNTYNSFIYFRF